MSYQTIPAKWTLLDVVAQAIEKLQRKSINFNRFPPSISDKVVHLSFAALLLLCSFFSRVVVQTEA
jgi:hypothetical protein